MATTVQAVKPFTLRDVSAEFTLPGSTTTYDFRAALEQCVFTPSTETQTWSGMTPDSSYADNGAETWQATLGYAQDWETANSLSRFLHDNAGKACVVKFRPRRSGVTTDWTATLVLQAGPIGGQGGQFATATVTCAVQGRPTPTAVANGATP